MAYGQLKLPGLEEANRFAETLAALDGDGCYNPLEGERKAEHYRKRIDDTVTGFISRGRVEDTASCYADLTRHTLDDFIAPLTGGKNPDSTPRNGMAQAYMVLRDISYGLQAMRLPTGVQRQMKPAERLAFYAGAGDLCARPEHYRGTDGPHRGFTVGNRHYSVGDVVDMAPEEKVSKVVSYGWTKNVRGFNALKGSQEPMKERVARASDADKVSDQIFNLFSGPYSLHDPNFGARWKGGAPQKRHLERYCSYILDQAP